MKQKLSMVILLLCFTAGAVLWIDGISARLFDTAFSSNPVQTLFHPQMIQTGSAPAAGYGSSARLSVLLSLFDSRFWLMVSFAVAGFVMLLYSTRQAIKTYQELEDRVSSLQNQASNLETALENSEKDAAVRLECCENFAHQMKSSLNSLSLRLELAGQFEHLEDSLNHMNMQLDGFLKSAVIHCNDPGLDIKPVSLKEILEQDVLPDAAGYSVRLETELMPGWLYGDRQLLAQAAETLLANACRHGSRVSIRLMDVKGGLCLEMKNDTSETGLPNLKRHHTAEPGHYGIGLDMAARTARLHGGNLTVSLENGWFIVSMQLPVHVWELPVCNVSENSL